MTMPLRLLLLLCVLLLAACHGTRFESRPSGTYASCDEAWVGSWQVTQDRSEGDIDTLGTLDVPDGCQPIQLHKAGEVAEGFDDYTFDYARVGDLQLLVGTPTADKGSDAQGGDAQEPGMLVFRYLADNDRIAVYGIDHVMVAQRILDGTLTGQTRISNRVRPGQARPHVDSIDNLIEGSGDEIATLLEADPTLFSTQPVLRLERTPGETGTPAAAP